MPKEVWMPSVFLKKFPKHPEDEAYKCTREALKRIAEDPKFLEFCRQQFANWRAEAQNPSGSQRLRNYKPPFPTSGSW